MNHHTNIMRLKTVAAALSALEDEIVFVGGAIISLYVPQPELTTIRVTDDVDVVLELISTGDFYRFQEKLISLGFRHDKNAPIISRYLYRGLKVDFMPTDPSILGFTNRWYKEGIQQKIKMQLDVATSICVFSTPYFLASKMEAFLGRGEGDLFASHDLEDIIYLLDHRPTIKEEIVNSPEIVKTYLIVHFQKLLKQPLFKEALIGHVEQQNPIPRANKIITLLNEMN
jgi:hypothetical protein